MFKMKKFVSFAVMGALAVSLIGCGKKSVSYKPLTDDNEETYQITVCQAENNDYENQITLGFTDALNDLFGSAHVNLDMQVANADASTDTICMNAVASQTQLLFTNGLNALNSAVAATDSIPVVATDVIDFHSALHIFSDQDAEWDRLSGTNVTGISSLAPIDKQLSLLIESTPNLETVGIIYRADDTNAIYQNEILESYLDQAGIPWREFEIPSSEDNTSDQQEIDTSSAIAPSKQVASSSKEGSNMDVESIGQGNLISGLISPSSARTAKTSATWMGPKTGGEELILGEDASAHDIIRDACMQSSALYIPAESLLTDQMSYIGETATNAGVVTLGGDTSLGENSLVSLYNDPYNMGYAAGKLAYRILVNEEDPGTIKINTANGTLQKLYNKNFADRLQMSFPKSFAERSEYLSTYEIGSQTTRIESDQSSDTATN